MRTRLAAVAAALVVLAVLLATPSAGQEKKSAEPEKSSVWMKKKLELSQNILAGLTESDFEKIRTNAESMNVLAYLEKYLRADMPEYKRQVTLFDFANRELIRQSREKNIDGATLAYNQLMISCVQCHKVVRDSKKLP